MSKEIELVNKFKENVGIYGKWIATVTRADGSIEVTERDNIVLSSGLNALAGRAVSETTSKFGFVAVGTQTAAQSLGSTVLLFGEVKRKAAITATSCREVFYLTTSWGGSIDAITSLTLDSAAIVNHVNSGQGTAMNIVNGLGVVLGNSDHLQLEVQVRVGSHNL